MKCDQNRDTAPFTIKIMLFESLSLSLSKREKKFQYSTQQYRYINVDWNNTCIKNKEQLNALYSFLSLNTLNTLT